jgi:signal transduction histidine kinase
MNFLRTKIILLICIFLSIAPKVLAVDAGDVLIVTSYSTDSKRIVDFVNSINSADSRNKYTYNLLIESLSCGQLSTYPQWHSQLNALIAKHRSPRLKALIFVGQEAWCTYVSGDVIPNLPFYGCYVSENGILIPKNAQQNFAAWNPESVNLIDLARSKGHAGGIFNRYDVPTNIKLIHLLYPSVKNVALLTDNTYGGLSLQSFVKSIMAKQFPEMKLFLLDGRINSVAEISRKLRTLPPSTAILVGTWRVDCNGSFIVQGTLKNMIPEKSSLPVFTLTGVGESSVAIGGFYPDYKINIGPILNDIHNYDNGIVTKNTYFFTHNSYQFNNNIMEQYGVKTFQLPQGSNIVTDNDVLVRQYKQYVFVAFIVITVILALLILVGVFYIRNRRANKTLNEQKAILSRQQKELIKAKEEAIRSDKLKSAFLANMSHEIRTPLNAIVGFSELLKDSDDSDERNQYWDIINTNNNLLLRLIGDILDLSKIESGMIELVPKRFDLSAMFVQSYSSLKQNIKTNKVEFKCVIPHKQCYVFLDENRVTQIITNFVNNSIKFTQRGHITMGYEIIDEGIRVFCEDTGIGIASENINKVFERFYKLNDFAQGTGLGMAICKAIADEQQGKIGVQSKLGKGSIFWAWLPTPTEFTD